MSKYLKTVLLITLCQLASFAMLAQEGIESEDLELARFEIGFNGSAMAHNVIGSGANLQQYPFDFMFNIQFTGSDLYLRSGLSYVRNTEDDDGGSSSQNDYRFRIGLAQGFDRNQKFDTSFGFDVILANVSSNSESNGSNSKTSLSLLSLGLGPSYTLNYQVSSRFSLRAESSLYFVSTTEEVNFSNFSGPNEVTSTRIELNTPLNVLMFVSF